jgi:multimeric flavodoxin WrbA
VSYDLDTMNALVLDGFRGVEGQSILAVLTNALAQAGYATEVVALRDKTIAPCLGCFGCWIKTPGECVIDDDGRAVARAAVRSDLLVYVTPVTFGGFSSELKKAVDRLIPNISPFFARVRGETHHQKRYPRCPSLIGLGILPQSDREAEAIFKTLVEHNALNFRSPRTAAAVVALDGTSDVAAIARGLIEAVAR